MRNLRLLEVSGCHRIDTADWIDAEPRSGLTLLTELQLLAELRLLAERRLLTKRLTKLRALLRQVLGNLLLDQLSNLRLLGKLCLLRQVRLWPKLALLPELALL